MLRKRLIFLFFIIVPVIIISLPGIVIAQEETTGGSNITITLEAPEQTITGQEVTFTAEVRETEYNEPVAGVPVDFFIKTEFFVNGLAEIGEALTDQNGLARIGYIPNQPGEIQVVASYKAGQDAEPVIAESTTVVSGQTKQFYQTMIGIEFPNSFFVWMASIVLALCVVWGTFIFVIYKVIVVNVSSRGSGAKGASIAFLVVVSLLFIFIIFVLVTPETQYNFGLLPG